MSLASRHLGLLTNINKQNVRIKPLQVLRTEVRLRPDEWISLGVIDLYKGGIGQTTFHCCFQPFNTNPNDPI